MRYRVQTWTHRLSTLEISPRFPQFLQANSGIDCIIVPDCFLPQLVQFIILNHSAFSGYACVTFTDEKASISKPRTLNGHYLKQIYFCHKRFITVTIELSLTLIQFNPACPCDNFMV